MSTVMAPVDMAQCDRCGARSKVLAVLPSGSTLAFCQHHANEHEPKLRELGAILADRQEGK
jgi:hypothetical protein